MPRAAASCFACSIRAAPMPWPLCRRDKQEVDVQFPLGGRRDVRRRDLGDHQRAEHHAVLILGDPRPAAARLVPDSRLALVVSRPRRGTPLLGISPRVHPLHGLIAKCQDRADVVGTTRTDSHDPFLAKQAQRTRRERRRPAVIQAHLTEREADPARRASRSSLPTRCASADGVRIDVGRSGCTGSVSGLRMLWSCRPRAGASACTRVLVAMVPPGPGGGSAVRGWLAGGAVVRGTAVGWPGLDGWGSRAGRSGRPC
jgi:hypothetical protein